MSAGHPSSALHALAPRIRALRHPENYLVGCDTPDPLPAVRNLLFFIRTDGVTLQHRIDRVAYYHHRYEMIIPLETGGTVFADGSFLDIAPGNLALVHPYETHGYPRIARKRMLWLFCTFEIPGNPVFDALRQRIVPLPPEAETLFPPMLDRYAPDSPARDAPRTLLALFSAFLALCDEHARQTRPAAPEPSLPARADGPIRAVCRHIDRHLSERLGVNDLAAVCDLSEGRLRARFRQTAGMSLGKYLRLRRIHKAAQMLRGTSQRAGEIARACGFDSVYTFSRAFSREMGMSPIAYRKDTR